MHAYVTIVRLDPVTESVISRQTVNAVSLSAARTMAAQVNTMGIGHVTAEASKYAPAR